jgi:dGTPase
LEELAEVELWNSAREKVAEVAAAKHIHAIRRVVLDVLLNDLLADAVTTSQALLASIGSPDEARAAGHPLAALSAEGEAGLADFERFMIKHVYQHPEIIETDIQSRWKVLALVIAYRKKPDEMPARFTARIEDQGVDRVVCDYVAGMTDRFCQAEYDRLFPPGTAGWHGQASPAKAEKLDRGIADGS